MKKYVIYRHIGNLSNLNNGWIKELNLISFHGMIESLFMI